MYNIKYYIILLTGIFLALGLGILIGITLESRDVLENQQINIVRQIEDSFMDLKNETDQLRDIINETEEKRNEYEELSKYLFNEIIRGKLNGLNVSLINLNKEYDFKEIVNLLEFCGATINAKYIMNLNTEFNEKKVETALAAFGNKAINNQNFSEIIIGELITNISSGRTSPLLEYLDDSEVIKILKPIEEKSDAIIISGLSSREDEYAGNIKTGEMIANMALEKDIRIVAVENLMIENSSITEYINIGISTVDNIDTIYGKLSLVSILTGIDGNYGQGERAENLMPHPLFCEDIEGNENEIDR